MLKILQKIKQATRFDLDALLSFLLFFLGGLTLGFIIANYMTSDIFCDGVQDYYLTDD